MADSLLRVFLDIVPKSTNAFTKALGLGSGGGGIAPAVATRGASEGLKAVTAGFSSMHKELTKLTQALRPEIVAKQVDLEIRLSKARAAVTKSEAKELRERTYGKGLSGLILSHLPGASQGARFAEKHGFNTKVGAVGGALAGGAGIALAGIGAGLAAVGARSPATLSRFEQVLLDVTAVVGESFIPVMDLATDGARLFGDFLASILPNANQMREVIAPLSVSLESMRTAVEPLIPAIGFVVNSLVGSLAVGVQIAATALEAMVAAAISVAGALGLITKGASPLKSSRGYAAVSAHFQGGEERGKAAYAAAFAGGAVRNAQEETAGYAKVIADNTRQMVEYLKLGKEGGDDVGGFAKNATGITAAQLLWSKLGWGS